METLLHYVWKYKLYEHSLLESTDQQTIEIIDPGLHNVHSGPDFFNAKVKIDGYLWAGNIEIHCRSSDWNLHRHQDDKAYNSVILHVIETNDQAVVYDQSGRKIPQFVLKVPAPIRKNYEYLVSRETPVPCAGRIREIPEIYLSDWKNALLLERLERKTQNIWKSLEYVSNDWNEVFYITLSRNFGFGINNDAFERLSKSLPVKCILRHKDSFLQTEALFFGQAGLLEESLEDDYYLSLQKEYGFLKQKYNLKPLESHIFKNLRIRPNNFPHIKLAQLAAFIRSGETIFSQILETESIEEIRKLFLPEVSGYWTTHYHFGKRSSPKKKMLGLAAIHLIAINTIVPILVAYGKVKGEESLISKGIRLLESIPKEENHITTIFRNSGIIIRSAADSQALIQLKNEYCDKKKCIFCRIGHQLLSKYE